MSLTFGLSTQVSDSGPQGHLFKFSLKKIITVLKSVLLSETVKRFLFPDWPKSMDVLPDGAHSIVVLPNRDTGRSENS